MKRNIAQSLHHEVQGHQATTDDIGALYDAAKAFFHLGLCPMADVMYISDIMNTMIMIDSFAAATGYDSKLAIDTLKKI